MKKLILSLVAVLIIQYAKAQNTPWSTTTSIGVGTTSPFYPFQVGGNIWNNLGSNYLLAVAGDAVIGNATSGSQPRLYIVEGTHGTGTTIQKFNGYTSISDGQGVINLNGNIGIGTTTPLEPLQVNGNIAAMAAANSTNTYFKFERASDGYTGARIGNVYEQSGYKGSLVFETNNGNGAISLSEAMRITSSGNVLINQTGQTNAAYKLDVAGSVRANAMTVNTSGADFVFEPSYKLNTLPELKDYIDKNHHLPEIASAKDMQANGVDLGQNQVKLLQKVEELTLYLIDKDQQLNEEKTKINKQQQEIDELKQQMQQLINTAKKPITNN